MKKCDTINLTLYNHLKDVQGAQVRLEHARAGIGISAQDEKLRRINVRSASELAAFARDAEAVRAQLSAARTLQQWLTAGVGDAGGRTAAGGDDPSPELPRLEDAIVVLGQWLRAPVGVVDQGADPRGGIVIVAAGLIVLLSLVLAWRLHWSMAVVAAAGPALYLVWHHLSRKRLGERPDARTVIEGEYAKLPVRQPGQWSPDQVQMLWQELSGTLAAVKLRQLSAQRWNDLKPQVDVVEQKYVELRRRREAIAGQLGVAPETDEAVLHLFVAAIIRWQQADADLHAARAKLESVQEQLQSVLAAAAELLSPYGYDVQNSADVEAARDALACRLTQYREGQLRITTAQRALEDAGQRLQELSGRISKLFEAVGLRSEGDDRVLVDWIARREAYLSGKRDLEVASARVRDAEVAIANDPQLSGRPVDELRIELEQAEADAGEETQLTEEIAAIRKEIELAKHASDLEQAQAEQREAEMALLTSRRSDCELAVGWALVDHLRNAVRERHRPAVFRRAREVFARVTRGRYQLELDEESESPEFRAIDTSTGIGHALVELSGGTRVQLLLAVRIAFVEQQEQGPRLPLLLDETLANSDELRARQIVDAVIEICRSGRQVFYFTAQPDEVGKWREILANQPQPGVPYQLIDLAAVRGLAETERTPLRRIVTAPPPAVPPSNGHSHEDYGRILKVPGIDRRRGAGSVHLWHIVDDVQLLHRLLVLGIETWGQWHTIVEHGGGVADGAETDAYHRTAARAKLLDSLGQLWRIGRGLPVDRHVIRESEAFSEGFVDDVAKVIAEEGGDAGRLILRLEDRAVARFRSASIEKLKQYLTEHAYLHERVPLSEQEMRLRAIASCERDLKSGPLSVSDLDRYLAVFCVSDQPVIPAGTP